MSSFESLKYLKFNEIPKCFYDKSLDPASWEEETIKELVQIGYYGVSENNFIPSVSDSQDIFPDDFFVHEADPIKYVKDNYEELQADFELKKKQEGERDLKIESDSKRIYWDNSLREFLYNKGIEIPTNEMSREFYLKNRISSVEKKNLVNLLSGYSESMFGLHDYVHPYGYALFGIGTSTYPDEYFDNLKKMFFEDGFDENAEYIEKAWAILDQNISRLNNYEEYVEKCFNESVAMDEKIRPVPRERFEFIKEKEQERYSVKKNLGDYFENKGEDLDFSICVEELYGGSCGNQPSSRYVENENSRYHSEKFIDSFKKNFVSYLEKSNFDFKEEISFLDSGNWDKDEEGNLVRTKNIKDVKEAVSTIRVNFSEGRNMHFYFQNQMADMKVKKERIDNLSFVQLMRGQFESNPIDDLKAAIFNGEKTGIYENPLILKWKRE